MSDFFYDVIIFDFDGVLVDSVDIKGKAFLSLYESYDESIRNQILEYHHLHGGISRYEKFKYFHNELLGLPLSESEIQKLDKQFSHYVLQKVIEAPEIDGANAFLKEFHEVIHCHLVSATPYGELLQIIKGRNMLSFFETIHGAPENKVDALKKIINKYGYNKNRVLMIGDALSDLRAAEAADIKFLGCDSANTNIFPHSIKQLKNLIQLKDFIKVEI